MLWIQEHYNISDGVLEYNVYEGTTECHAPGKKAFVDSWFNCWLFQLPFVLENLGFGYVCFALIIPIMLISIFGKIQHSYRWFILNQAFWDFFIIYNFICDKPTWNTWFKSGYIHGWFKEYHHNNTEEWLQSINQRPPTCFYSSALDEASINNWFKHILSTVFYTAASNASFAPLFLLTFSRFLCLYYHQFYERFAAKKVKMILTFFGFNVFCVAMVNLDDWYTVAAKIAIEDDYKKCAEVNCNGRIDCSTCIYRYYHVVYTPYFKVIQNFLPPLTLIITDILGICIIIKIVRQFKYQAKHNRYNLINSLKIACIILFQCFTMTFLFVISFTENVLTMLENFGVTNDQTISQTWPSWIRFLTLASTVQSVNIIRIFLDSCIVLSLLSDYHRVVVESGRFIIVLILHPKMTFLHVKKQLLNRKISSEGPGFSQYSTHSKKVVPISMISR